ncbi:MAG: oxygenase MpaB family protein [Deltaproteobacteria bacterium]
MGASLIVAPRVDVGDPKLDALLDTLEDPSAVWRTIAALDGLRDAAPLPRDIPEPLARFLRFARLPVWAQSHRMARGARFAEENLPYVSISLVAGALPLLFTSADGARVLTTTRRLLDDLDRRVNETARFAFAILAPDAFGPDGSGIRAALRVRLIHAAVRRSQRQQGSVPINEAQLLGTLFAFSVVVLKCVTRLGARVTDRDREDYWHLWRVVGALLGIDERVMPRRYVQAERAMRRLLDAYTAPSPAGRALTAVLLEGIQRHLLVPEVSPWLVRYLLGERVADLIDVPRPRQNRLDARWVRRHAPRIFVAVKPLLGRTLHEAVVRRKLAPRA